MLSDHGVDTLQTVRIKGVETLQLIKKMVRMGPESVRTLNELTPTDAAILEYLDHQRDAPANIADATDRNRRHVGTRLTHLRELDLVERVGRESVSIHEITDDGERILEHYTEIHATN